MKLLEIRQAYEEFSGKSSNLNRQLCFAGIVIILMFNKQNNEIILPALLLYTSLLFDFLQYFISTFVLYGYYLYHKKKDQNDEDINVNESEWLNAISWLLFIAKSILLIKGYILIGYFLISKI